jgi:hypothetical protein
VQPRQHGQLVFKQGVTDHNKSSFYKVKLEQFLTKGKEKKKKRGKKKEVLKRCGRVSSLDVFHWTVLFVCGYLQTLSILYLTLTMVYALRHLNKKKKLRAHVNKVIMKEKIKVYMTA